MASDVHIWTASEASAVLGRHGVEVQSIEPMAHTGWGGDSDAFLVNGTHVFRFGRYEHVREMYAVERRFLAELAPRLEGTGVDVPRFSHFGGPAEGEEAVFVGYPLIAGEQLTAERLAALEREDPEAVEGIAARLGAFLTALHGIPVAVGERCGLRAAAFSLREQIARQRERIEQRIYPVLDQATRRFLEGVFRSFLEDNRFERWPLAVCHGDFGPDHILVRPGRRDTRGRVELCGVIDYGDACIGDPSGDLVWRRWYGAAFFEKVMARYAGPVRDREALEEMIRIRTALVPTAQIGWGLDTGSVQDVEEGKERLREVMNRW